MRLSKLGIKTVHRLSGLMNPSSIAIVGASPRSEAMGNTVLKNLLNVGYKGEIFPIHPNADEVLGIRCFKSLTESPKAVDCVVIALGAEHVLRTLQEMKALRLKNAVLFASGFAETGEQGSRLQAEMAEYCKSNDINLCGPNCLGIYSVVGAAAMYSAAAPEGLAPGRVALISQSGSACIALSNLRRFDFSYLVSLGNGAVTDVHDYLEFVAQDESTSVVAMFLESIRSPNAFKRAAKLMRRAGKRIVALKVGRSATGAAASAAHTGAIASSDTALQAFLADCGVALVEDYDELTETCDLLLNAAKPIRGKGLGVLNVSGGELALTCDIAERNGLRLPDLSSSTIDRLREVLPAFGTPRNPLDATGAGVFDTKMYGGCLAALAADPSIDIIAVSQDCPNTMGAAQAAIYHELAKTVAEEARKIEKTVIFFNNVSGDVHPAVQAPLQAARVPVLHGMSNALRAIGHLMRQAQEVKKDGEESNPVHLRQPQWVDRLKSATPLTESEAKDFLREHGIRVPAQALALTERDAVEHAVSIGFPVVMKIESADISHKSEVGGVIVNVATADAARTAYRTIMANAAQKAPDALINGVLIQQMVMGGVEALIGVVTHRPFGPGIVVGSGGVLVELISDSKFRLAPVSKDAARDMLNTTKLFKLLDGFRGAAKADLAALANDVELVSLLAVAYEDLIEAVDINPMAVLPRGKGTVALDALIITKAQTA